MGSLKMDVKLGKLEDFKGVSKDLFGYFLKDYFNKNEGLVNGLFEFQESCMVSIKVEVDKVYIFIDNVFSFFIGSVLRMECSILVNGQVLIVFLYVLIQNGVESLVVKISSLVYLDIFDVVDDGGFDSRLEGMRLKVSFLLDIIFSKDSVVKGYFLIIV